MGYHDPCDNNAGHGHAVVGIGPTGGTKWVCLDCFNDYLAATRKVIAEKLADARADAD